MKEIVVNGADLFWIVIAITLAVAHSGWWALFVPLIVSTWFISPRWSRKDGWRLWR